VRGKKSKEKKKVFGCQKYLTISLQKDAKAFAPVFVIVATLLNLYVLLFTSEKPVSICVHAVLTF
jgi:hypothetical protein